MLPKAGGKSNQHMLNFLHPVVQKVLADLKIATNIRHQICRTQGLLIAFFLGKQPENAENIMKTSENI